MNRPGSRHPVVMMAGILALLTGGVTPVLGQDLEVVSRLTGIPLPDGYWARKAADPLAFELPNGFFGTRAHLPPVTEPALVAQAPEAMYQGVARLPVILALFADSPEPWLSAEDVAASLFDGPAPRGTLTDFYSEASYGTFSVEGDVLPWVRSSLTLSQVVGEGYGLGADSRVGEYLVEALEAVDGQVDFTRYDNDGPDGIPDSGDDDGVADVVAFEFLEISASCGGPGIWPHRWGISGWRQGVPWVSDDIGADGSPVTVDGYVIQGATDCTGSNVQSAATMAHEFGHALGLPDYYHPVDGITPDLRRWVLGCWDLMAAGSWGCGPVTQSRPDFGPTHMTAWNRHVLGWLDFREVGPVRDSVIELRPIRTSGDALRIPLPGGVNGESLLLEFRDTGGFDRDLPASGVLVARLYPEGDLRPQEGESYYLSVVEADGSGGLLRVLAEGGDRGSAGDVFGGPVGMASLNGLTNPSTRTVSGAQTGIAFHSFQLQDGRAWIRLSTHPDPALVLPETPLNAVAGIPGGEGGVLVAGGYLPLTARIGGGAPRGLEFEGEGEWLRLSGIPLEAGTFQVEIEARDARGSTASGTVTVVVSPFQMDMARLADAVLGGTPLTGGEATYLDGNGNKNGNLDVGDVRAWRFSPGSQR